MTNKKYAVDFCDSRRSVIAFLDDGDARSGLNVADVDFAAAISELGADELPGEDGTPINLTIAHLSSDELDKIADTTERSPRLEQTEILILLSTAQHSLYRDLHKKNIWDDQKRKQLVLVPRRDLIRDDVSVLRQLLSMDLSSARAVYEGRIGDLQPELCGVFGLLEAPNWLFTLSVLCQSVLPATKRTHQPDARRWREFLTPNESDKPQDPGWMNIIAYGKNYWPEREVATNVEALLEEIYSEPTADLQTDTIRKAAESLNLLINDPAIIYTSGGFRS